MYEKPVVGTFGSYRPIPASRKHLLVHLLDQLILHRKRLVELRYDFFDTDEEFWYAMSDGIASVLTRYYHINAFAIGDRHLVTTARHEFNNELRPMYEAICAEQNLQRSILDAAGTLDAEVGLRISGFHLYADIVTFPFQATISQVGQGVGAFAQTVLANHGPISHSTITNLLSQP